MLKESRKKAKVMRTKIVGAGNTMESYGDKFLPAPNNNKTKKEKQPGFDPDKPQIAQFQQTPQNFARMGSYDSYSKGKSEIFKHKVDDIVEGVKKKEEELRQNEKGETYDDFDFLGLEECEIDKEHNDNKVDFLNDSK